MGEFRCQDVYGLNCTSSAVNTRNAKERCKFLILRRTDITDDKTNKTKSKPSKKKKVILGLLGVLLIVFCGYHLQILIEAKHYGTTYSHMKSIKEGNKMWEKVAKENLLHDKGKTF